VGQQKRGLALGRSVRVRRPVAIAHGLLVRRHRGHGDKAASTIAFNLKLAAASERAALKLAPAFEGVALKLAPSLEGVALKLAAAFEGAASKLASPSEGVAFTACAGLRRRGPG
jgi:hypothetical protein